MGGAKSFRYDENGDVMSTIAVGTCALNNNVIISPHSVGPDAQGGAQRPWWRSGLSLHSGCWTVSRSAC